MTVFADMTVRAGERILHVSPALRVSAAGKAPLDAELGAGRTLSLARIDADRQRVDVVLPASAAHAVAIVDPSSKPLSNRVWLGTLIEVPGAILVGFRRAAARAPQGRAATVRGPQPAGVAEAVPNVRRDAKHASRRPGESSSPGRRAT